MMNTFRFYVATMVTVLAVGTTTPVQAQQHAPKLEEPVVAWTNHYRALYGRAGLKVNPRLSQAARLQAWKMALHDRMSHSLDGKTVTDRVSDAGYAYQVVGENVGFSEGFANPARKCFEGWMYSPAHWRNIQDRRYTEMGVGVYQSPSGKYYLCQVFASGAATSPSPPAVAATPPTVTATVPHVNPPVVANVPAAPQPHFPAATPPSQRGLHIGIGVLPVFPMPDQYYSHPFTPYTGW